MKIRLLVIWCLLLLISSCTDESYQEIPRSELIHDNSSKVWIMDEFIEHGEHKESTARANRECLIFYKDRVVYSYLLKDFGIGNSSKGTFIFSSSNSIKFEWMGGFKEGYKIEKLNSEKLILVDSTKKIRKVYIAFDRP